MKLNPTAKRRIGKLIAFMESLPKSAEAHFRMTGWFRHRDDHEHATARDGTITKRTLMGCGTSACAAGWAATIPEFKKAGFTYNTLTGFSVEPEEFFGTIGNPQLAEQLFYNFDIETPKEWARNARRVIGKA